MLGVCPIKVYVKYALYEQALSCIFHIYFCMAELLSFYELFKGIKYTKIVLFGIIIKNKHFMIGRQRKRGAAMKYEELVENVRIATKHATVSRAVGHVAFQFNVVGEAEGAFYLEIADGKINVEPYEYYDRDIIIVTSADVIMQMAEGRLMPKAAYSNGLLTIHGDVEQLNVLPFGGRM